MVSCSMQHGVMQHAAWSSIDRRPHDKRAGGGWSAEANQEAGGGGGWGGANVKITQVPLPPSRLFTSHLSTAGPGQSQL